jgi:hypothetical protein
MTTAHLLRLRPGPLAAAAAGLMGLAAAGLEPGRSEVEPVPLPAGHPTLPAQDDDTRYLHGRELCARCHDASPRARALRAADGRDISPVHTLGGTVMQAAFVDPFFRAQLERERRHAADPEAARALEAECLRCHAPVAHHERTLAGRDAPDLEEALTDAFVAEGVSCTVCHRIGPEGLGTPETWSGHPPMDREARLYGPYPEPFVGPMRVNTGYEVTYGPHMVLSSLCATCHTLETHHGEEAFLEQGAYLEWRNSVYSYESKGVTEETRSCQACHMPDVGPTRLAHNPGGRDFPFLDERPEVRSHRIVGGNARLLDLLAAGGEALGAPGTPEQYRDTARATREQLQGRTAELALEDPRVEDGRLRAEVRVTNRAGHKLPTGFPSRRVWLELEVEGPDGTWFHSGAPDAQGRVLPPERALREPHHKVLERADQVQVWERVAVNEAGEPTTRVGAMVGTRKDNRLLPLGWSPVGPDAARTGAVGAAAEDEDFAGGEDRVALSIPLPEGLAPGRHRIRARLHFQTMPPAWVDDLRGGTSPEEQGFVALFDGTPGTSEVLAETRGVVRVE